MKSAHKSPDAQQIEANDGQLFFHAEYGRHEFLYQLATYFVVARILLQRFGSLLVRLRAKLREFLRAEHPMARLT